MVRLSRILLGVQVVMSNFAAFKKVSRDSSLSLGVSSTLVMEKRVTLCLVRFTAISKKEFCQLHGS